MLHSLHIENFKSLKSVSLRLQQVNLLIGPNNSGKTNLLKALELWGKIMMGEDGISYNALAKLLPQYFFQRKHSHDTKAEMRFATTMLESPYKTYSSVELLLHFSRLQPLEYSNDYTLCYTSSKKLSNIQISKSTRFVDLNAFDRFVLTTTKFKEIDIPQNTTNISVGNRVGLTLIKDNNTVANDGGVPYLLSRKSIFNLTAGISLSLYEYLEGAFIYKPDPRKMMSIAPLYAGNERLLADASNMVAFLDTMLGKYPKVISSMAQDLERCLGDFIGIRLDSPEVPQDNDLRKLHKEGTFFKRLGLEDKRGVIYWADELSEGTLYFLALLAIVHQPNPPKLLMLEEPETAIHPRRIREVLDLIFGLAQENDIQVIMTTHSPLVVDAFAEMPEAIHVVDIDNGETSIRNLQHDIIAPAHADCDAKGLPRINYTESLGEHWSIGFLGGVPK